MLALNLVDQETPVAADLALFSDSFDPPNRGVDGFELVECVMDLVKPRLDSQCLELSFILFKQLFLDQCCHFSLLETCLFDLLLGPLNLRHRAINLILCLRLSLRQLENSILGQV